MNNEKLKKYEPFLVHFIQLSLLFYLIIPLISVVFRVDERSSDSYISRDFSRETPLLHSISVKVSKTVIEF